MAKLRKNWLSYLTQEEIKQIDAASRRVLAEVGVRIEDQELVSRLLDKGCTNEKGRVQFPSDVVDAALAGVKNEVVLVGRNGERLHLREGYVATHTGGSIPYVYDPVTWEKRDATQKDLVDMLKVMNQLENLSMPGGLVTPMEAPSAISEVRQMEATMRYCLKPISGTAVSSAAQARYVLEMYRVMVGCTDSLDGAPMMSLGISPEKSTLLSPGNPGYHETLYRRRHPDHAPGGAYPGFHRAHDHRRRVGSDERFLPGLYGHQPGNQS